jgi:hypothetical protein
VGLALVVVFILVVLVFSVRVALFRRARIGGRARMLMNGPLAPARRIARRRRFRR